ncbi:hypothetical protein ACF061_01105 [Streptomyces sp. NPDC015220]|uniref:hypothetical protein n=1 Tax=Streptomyces sp. NPDC015220 TaxID=3364947 RepID=UPI0036FE072C
MVDLLGLPPTPISAAPVIVRGLLPSLGVTEHHRRPVPAWVTDPDAIDSIARGLYELDDEETGPFQVRTLWAARDAGLLDPGRH